MATAKRYSRDPITEAILDFQVKLPPGAAFSDLDRCGNREKKRYPTKETLNLSKGLLALGPELSASATSEQIGFRFLSSDKKAIFQAHRHGFTFNQLAPYQGWDAFQKEARRLWGIYREVAKPLAIERVAVRFINRIDLPSPTVDLKEYLRTSPEISPELPQLLEGFFMRVQISQEEIRSMLVLNETIVQSPRPNTVSVLLDIDLFRTVDLPQEEAGIWRIIEDLRLQKNKVFEACITDETRKLIQ